MRYYGTSNVDPAFKKHVSWVQTASGPSDVAVVEYRGVQPCAMMHGNGSKTTVPYVRTPASTMDHVGDAVGKATSKVVYTDCLLAIDVADAPRNSCAVREKKYRQAQNARRNVHHRLNFADEILAVTAMAQDDAFVRCVQISGNRVPCVILYRD